MVFVAASPSAHIAAVEKQSVQEQWEQFEPWLSYVLYCLRDRFCKHRGLREIPPPEVAQLL